MTQPRWATEDAVAQHVSVSIYTVRRWRDQGRITAHKIGHRLLRYDLNEIDAMITAGQETA